MATNPEEYAAFQAQIINTVRRYRDVQQKEGDVSPIAECLIRLEGQEVTDFSSQYGGEASISYVACNLAGKACVFPSYGDYTQACVFRTYGPWWKVAPSGCKRYRGTPSDFTSEDFIEISFTESLFPVRIEVYETYNPGAIVRIMACDRAGGTDADKGEITWVTLWSGNPKPCKQRPRIFAPHLRKIDFATNLIRMELCHNYLDYYTELDAIKLVGTKTPPCNEVHIHQPVLSVDSDEEDDVSLGIIGFTQKQEEHCQSYDGTVATSKSVPPTNSGWVTAGFTAINKKGNADLASGDSVDPLVDSVADIVLDRDQDDFFTLLPKEIVHLLLSYLDLRDLCKLSQTCSLLREHCYDPLLYIDLNLQPFWTQINDSSLLALTSRCERVQRLNLSWCGKGGPIYTTNFVKLLKSCTFGLRSLELSSCKFVDSSMLMAICETCPDLEELNLSGCTNIDDFAVFNMLPLRKLQKINLYRTKIDYPSISVLLRTSPDLEHLNISSCLSLMSNINLVMMDIGDFCKKLISLDLWRMKFVNDECLAHVYTNCPLLEELDLGWCKDLKSDGDCLVNLAKNCKHLKKLFVTANRFVRDPDLEALAKYCPKLEQLDILGTRDVSKTAIVQVLESCKQLIFLDVSFCVGISPADACAWRATYPHVAIKKSFQNISIT